MEEVGYCIQREAQLLQYCRHPNIIAVQDSFCGFAVACLVLPVHGISLKVYNDTKGNVTGLRALLMMQQSFAGMGHMHELGVSASPFDVMLRVSALTNLCLYCF